MEVLNENEAEFLRYEIWDRSIYEQFGIEIHDDSVVVDCGANIGLFSLYCLENYRNVAVLAIEPLPDIVDALKKNIGNKNCKIVPFGICSISLSGQKLEFTYFPEMPGESSRFYEEQLARSEKIKNAYESFLVDNDVEESDSCSSLGNSYSDLRKYHIESFSLGDLLEANESFIGSSIDFLKVLAIRVGDLIEYDLCFDGIPQIDVEGSELECLQGLNDKWWNQINQISMGKKIYCVSFYGYLAFFYCLGITLSYPCLEVYDCDGRLKSCLDLLKSRHFEVHYSASSVEVRSNIRIANYVREVTFLVFS